MILYTLLIWSCGAHGCHAEPLRSVYQHLSEPSCVEMRMAQEVSAGSGTSGVWTVAACGKENGKR